MLFRLFILSTAFVSLTAQARVFDMTKEQFASYLVFSGGPSAIADAAFAKESAATDSNGSVALNTSFEFGFLYVTKTVSWRFGFEVMKPSALPDVTATNAGGTALYHVKSDVIGYYPKLGLELNLKTTGSSRIFLTGAAGTTSLNVTNEYSELTIAPHTDFTMKYKGNATTWSAGLGYEFAAFDTTTLVFEAGYRKMNVDKLVYSEAVPASFDVAHAAGDSVTRTDGDPRGIDLTGYYASLGFRFFLF